MIQLNTDENFQDILDKKLDITDEKLPHLYIQMELCKIDLKKWLEKNKVSNLTRIRIFREILNGVDYLHKKNFMHRDLTVITTSNIENIASK